MVELLWDFGGSPSSQHRRLVHVVVGVNAETFYDADIHGDGEAADTRREALAEGLWLDVFIVHGGPSTILLCGQPLGAVERVLPPQ